MRKNGLTRKFLGKILKHVSVVDDVKKLYCMDLDAVYVTTPIVSHFQLLRENYMIK